MNRTNGCLTLDVEAIDAVCPVGEAAGEQMIAEGRIPVISCEGGCVRGEIARQAANLVGKEDPYRRSCHGELFTAPHSAIAEWSDQADKTVVIDGCFMHCHGRIAKKLPGEGKVVLFDAMAYYDGYRDLMCIDDVPEADRLAAARQVADGVLSALRSQG